MSFLKLEHRSAPIEEGVTPRAVFDHVRGPYSCLLESGKVVGGGSEDGGLSADAGRYSYIVFDPFMLVWSDQGTAQTQVLHDFGRAKKSDGRTMRGKEGEWLVTDVLADFRFKDQAPVPFFGGAVGFLSYEFGCKLMEVKQQVYMDVDLPDYLFGLYNRVIAFDHKEGKLYFLAVGETDLEAKRLLDSIEDAVSSMPPIKRKGEVGEMKVSVSKDGYDEKIERIQEHLRKGETYQVNYSLRFQTPSSLDPWAAYEHLSDINPSPFACYMEFPEFSIVSCSPELLLRKRGRQVETWPIKGTVPRGKNAEEDVNNANELLSSEKDEAELAMIVDLCRNDLGKVCVFGTVEVAEHREIQNYSHVIHTVSKVTGKLRHNASVFDLVKAVFPGGSITGCPKKRTMEIIDQLESYGRGVYTGSAGFISFSGNLDLNILIRTMLFSDDMVYFHAGGGIVLDSVADAEYGEAMQKAGALLDICKV